MLKKSIFDIFVEDVDVKNLSVIKASQNHSLEIVEILSFVLSLTDCETDGTEFVLFYLNRVLVFSTEFPEFICRFSYL